MPDTRYAEEISHADIDGHRIERLRMKESGDVEIRFSWWKDGRFMTRPLDLSEDDLLPLMQQAMERRVFSDEFLRGPQGVLAEHFRH